MKLHGIWWSGDKKKVHGTLEVTDENCIYLTTDEKLYDVNIINGFAEGIPITLVDNMLDRTKTFHSPVNPTNDCYIDQKIEMKYSTYCYTSETLIMGYAYERKGDIRLSQVKVTYTRFPEWAQLPVLSPDIVEDDSSISMVIQKSPIMKIKLFTYSITIGNPYHIDKSNFIIQISNEPVIVFDDILISYIGELERAIYSMQYFLILCTGDNINIEQIHAVDVFHHDLVIILGSKKSNYENRSSIKGIIGYQDIISDIDHIFNNWHSLFLNNELLMLHFINLHRREEPLASEYTNLMSSIDNLYLAITHKEQTKESFVNIVTQLIHETNFILHLSQDEIEEIAKKTKEYRRYFIHSNKAQRDMVYQNITMVKLLFNFLVEVIRANIMLEIGISRQLLETYYHNKTDLQSLKNDMISNFDPDEEIWEERENIMKPLSKNDRELIAKVNASLGMRYRERGYNLENTEDLVELTQYLTAEFMDLLYFTAQIDNMRERFDYGMEIYHPEKWAKLTSLEGTKDTIIADTYSCLAEASENFYALSNEAEEKCLEIWKLVLNHKEASNILVGEMEEYELTEIEKALNDLVDNIFEIPYHDQVEEDTREFGKKLKEILEHFKQ